MKQSLLVGVLGCCLGACGAPRSVTETARVVPSGDYRVAVHYVANLASASGVEAAKTANSAFEDATDGGSVNYGDSLRDGLATALAFALDPISLGGFDFSLRYGVYDRVDVGYKWATGVHAFDAKVQFYGPVAKEGESTEDRNYGSIGVQYSSQSYELPSVLGKVQEIIDFKLDRSDIMVPLTFSHAFGEHEKIAGIGYGLVWARGTVDYGLDPDGKLTKVVGSAAEPIDAVSGSQSFDSYGVFVNGKLGYKWVYLAASLAIYSTDYGTWELLDGDERSFDGVTVVPSLGLHGNF